MGRVTDDARTQPDASLDAAESSRANGHDANGHEPSRPEHDPIAPASDATPLGDDPVTAIWGPSVSTDDPQPSFWGPVGAAAAAPFAAGPALTGGDAVDVPQAPGRPAGSPDTEVAAAEEAIEEIWGDPPSAPGAPIDATDAPLVADGDREGEAGPDLWEATRRQSPGGVLPVAGPVDERWTLDFAAAGGTGGDLRAVTAATTDAPAAITDAPAAITDAPAAITDAPAAITDAPAAAAGPPVLSVPAGEGEPIDPTDPMRPVVIDGFAPSDDPIVPIEDAGLRAAGLLPGDHEDRGHRTLRPLEGGPGWLLIAGLVLLTVVAGSGVWWFTSRAASEPPSVLVVDDAPPADTFEPPTTTDPDEAALEEQAVRPIPPTRPDPGALLPLAVRPSGGAAAPET
jgi:hypothetical protein